MESWHTGFNRQDDKEKRVRLSAFTAFERNNVHQKGGMPALRAESRSFYSGDVYVGDFEDQQRIRRPQTG